VRVGEKQFPAIHALVRRCAETLQIRAPTVYVSPQMGGLRVRTLGPADDATILLGAGLIDHLGEPELLFVLGRECGHVQNGHTVYLTALYFLSNAANMIVRWGSQPAVIALNGWSRRAEITADRAGLLCARELAVATEALVKLAIGSRKVYGGIDVEEYLRQLDEHGSGPGRFHELFSRQPYLPKRVQALRLFAETTFFRSVLGVGSPDGAAPGLSKEECDARVSELLSVFK